jgi:hypothetical protein
MHTTPTGEKIKTLKTNIQQYEKDTKLLARIPEMKPAVRERQAEIDRLKEEVTALEASGNARIEDLHVWEMQKDRGKRTYTYWMASWREQGGKVHNVHLGSTKKLSREMAQEKAKRLKAEAFGMGRYF